MESAAVFLVGIAIIWLVFWVVRSDGAPTIGDQRGMFRMRPPAAPVSDPGQEADQPGDSGRVGRRGSVGGR